MDCENCTQSIYVEIAQQGYISDGENCWIVVIVSLLFTVGLYKLLRIVIRALSPLSWIPYDLHKRYVSNQVKSWAFITGASQGIGFAFAEQLAKRNFNIIIMSRSEIKLKKAQQSINKINPNVEVKYFQVDFQTLLTAQQYEQLYALIKEYDISVLVNNVGILNKTKFLDSTYERIRKQTVINLMPVACLTRLLLPQMIERCKKYNKRAAIINISSGSSQSQLSYCSNYCATKAYDDLLTHSLEVEYRREPIDFLSVKPYLVTSSMTMGQKSWLHVTCNQCAKGALRDLGKYSVSYGSYSHHLQGVLVDELNGKLVNYIMCVKSKEVSLRYKELREKNK